MFQPLRIKEHSALIHSAFGMSLGPTTTASVYDSSLGSLLGYITSVPSFNSMQWPTYLLTASGPAPSVNSPDSVTYAISATETYALGVGTGTESIQARASSASADESVPLAVPYIAALANALWILLY